MEEKAESAEPMLLTLPDELIIQVFEWLPPTSYARDPLAAVNSRIRSCVLRSWHTLDLDLYFGRRVQVCMQPLFFQCTARLLR